MLLKQKLAAGKGSGAGRFLVMFPIWLAAALFSISHLRLYFSLKGRTESGSERGMIVGNRTHIEMHFLRAVEGEGGDMRRQRDIVMIGTHAQRQTAKRLLVARHRSARLADGNLTRFPTVTRVLDRTVSDATRS